MNRPLILVTGGNGQVGSELKIRAAEFSNFNFLFIDKEDIDLTDSKALHHFLSTQSIDYIINCAAYTAVDQAEGDMKNAQLVNQEVPSVLADYCREHVIRLIHLSTDYVFDGTGNKPIIETDKPNPLSVYGKTKLDGEREILEKLNNAYIIRTSWVYSSYGKNFVKTMLRLGESKERLDVVYDQIGTPTNASDLAGVLLVIIQEIEAGNDNPGIYHYTNEGITSWYDFAVTIMKLANINCHVYPIPTSGFKTAAQRPAFTVLDKTKIKNQFKLEIPYWADSLEKTITILRR